MSDGTGLAKIASSVRRCLAFILSDTRKRRHAPQPAADKIIRLVAQSAAIENSSAEVAALDLMPANRPLLRRADPDKPLRSAQLQCDENRSKLSLGDGRNVLDKHDSILCSGLDASTIGVEAPAAA
jgi:hypothetical protein